MSILRLALNQILEKPLQSGINLLVMALGLGMVSLLLLGQHQFQERMGRDAEGIDLVVGAAGSPMQLILSSVYHVDIPTGNIPAEARDVVAEERAVALTIPLALGDNYQGYRLVGTETTLIEHYGGTLAEGRHWDQPLEAVAGARAARETGLAAGDEFAPQHGLGDGGPAHGEHPHRVVGVLEPTGTILDRLILTSVASVWRTHGHDHGHDEHGEEHDHGHDHEHGDAHDEAGNPGPGQEPAVETHGEAAHGEPGEFTALLVRYAAPIAAARLPDRIDRETPWQSASPAYQSARLASLIDPGVRALQWLGALLLGAALLGVVALIYQNLAERRYDLALLRAMGARPGLLFRLTLIQGLILVMAGLVTGLAASHLALEVLGRWTEAGRDLALTGWTWTPAQSWLAAGILGAGLVLTLIPAWLAARTEVAGTLRHGPD